MSKSMVKQQQIHYTCQNGFCYVMVESSNKTLFLFLFSQRLKYLQQWYGTLETSSKFCVYRNLNHICQYLVLDNLAITLHNLQQALLV